MTADDIRAHVAALKSAIEDDDEKVGLLEMTDLLVTTLVDLHRIADALDSISLSLIPKS
jgi:hypothetical protein